jgi:rRNA-processing protein FCF1
MALSKSTVQIAVVIPRTVKEELKEYAEAHHWSMSQAAALLIADGLKREKDDKKS